MGKKIIAVDVRLPRLIQYPAADVFVDKLVGKTVEGIGAQGQIFTLEFRAGFIFIDSFKNDRRSFGC